MGRKKGDASRGSQSKRSIIEEAPPQEQKDLSHTFKAKFPIISNEEGDKFTILKFREIIGCKYIPNSLFNDVGMSDSFNELLTTSGLNKFVSMHEDVYVELITEFYTTLDVNANNSQIMEFRLLGNKHQLQYSFMQRVFGFKRDGLYNPPNTF